MSAPGLYVPVGDLIFDLPYLSVVGLSFLSV